MLIIISNEKNPSFNLYRKDFLCLTMIIKDRFTFLYKTYIFYFVFKLVYFSKKKTFAFDNKLNILDFKKK